MKIEISSYLWNNIYSFIIELLLIILLKEFIKLIKLNRSFKHKSLQRFCE